ncbi:MULTISPECIES: peptidoglycan editing factor PgeF [Mesobacillus]|uniref:Purine nucleoside phosphorylase n=2 Tax=Mesobacillus TaxID=2675231 RepID=A0A0D6Z6L8_9BACI|nr:MULTISPECIES: peptidoglycan editing factor PgeF [Mesobacillus]KIY20696.1 laccase [Mesobacillus subterraneus]MDQ0412585.1 YfiH family protein [Mesobacillus stamsii]
MEPFILKNPEFFILKEWMERFPGLEAGFTTKNGGVSQLQAFSGLNFAFHVGDDPSSVCENRLLLANKIDFPLPSWVGAEQTHGIQIAKIDKADQGKGSSDYRSSFLATDGFLTLQRGILLTLCFADCVPLYFIEPETKMIGIAHAGWKGTVHGIAAEMISKFKQNGANSDKILVIIGPSICKKCYIVDERVINLVKNRLDGVEKLPYNQISEGQYSLDLQELNRDILVKAGIKDENIETTEYCTSCHSEHFYSHRRDKGNAGRMIAYIGWKEDSRP